MDLLVFVPSWMAAGVSVNLSAVFSFGFMILVGLLILISILKSFIQIAPPSSVLVVSGRARETEAGMRGYRISKSGSYIFRIPVLERVDEIDLTIIPIGIEIRNAYSKGGIALDVQAVANVKISADPVLFNNAIERFLGRDRRDIMRAAKDTLEGNLREVLATLTPEEVNEDRLRFAQNLLELAEDDLEKLGLHLDTLKIQHVSDHSNYLNSIGRQRIAMIIREAEIAESNTRREAENVAAEAKAAAQVVREQTEAVTARKRNELRELKAELELKARAEEEKTMAAAQEARASAEQELQTIRAELEQLRLMADKVLPAEAMQQAREMQAKAVAAPIAENGKAQAQALQMISDSWANAGEHAKDIFVIQQLEQILELVVATVNDMKVGEVHLIDNGNGDALPQYVSSFPKTVASLLKTLRESTGVDVTEILTKTPIKTDVAEG